MTLIWPPLTQVTAVIKMRISLHYGDKSLWLERSDCSPQEMHRRCTDLSPLTPLLSDGMHNLCDFDSSATLKNFTAYENRFIIFYSQKIFFFHLFLQNFCFNWLEFYFFAFYANSGVCSVVFSLFFTRVLEREWPLHISTCFQLMLCWQNLQNGISPDT